MSQTPTPWITDHQFIKANDKIVAECYGPADSYEGRNNARHIVKCVNKHDELIDLLVRTLDAVNVWQANEAPLLLSQIKAAIGWGE